MSVNHGIPRDPNRTAWIIAHLQFANSESPTIAIDAWELAIANNDQIHSTTAETLEHPETSEHDAYTSLIESLNPYRHEGTVIVTIDADTIPQLRQRMLQSSPNKPVETLRGFRHVSLDQTIREYVDTELTEYGLASESRPTPRITDDDTGNVVASHTVQEAWRCWQNLIPVIPHTTLRGEKL